LTKISPMLVVSDADVLIHLSKLEKLPILKALYKEVAVPKHVKSEVLVREDTKLQNAFNSFLKVSATSWDKAEKIAKRHHIHTGEAHVKVLGEELRATLFLSNEKKVRKAAKEEGFAVCGTIGIILRAVKKELIDKSEAEALFEKMKAKDFRIHPDILQKAISAIKEI
jgi:predicted nucleic acid-binding protein